MKSGFIQNNEMHKAPENHFRPRHEDVLKCDLNRQILMHTFYL